MVSDQGESLACQVILHGPLDGEGFSLDGCVVLLSQSQLAAYEHPVMLFSVPLL